VIGFPAVVVVDAPLLLRALEVYEIDRIDRSIDRIATVQRIEPA
jgi:hypothetical protein